MTGTAWALLAVLIASVLFQAIYWPRRVEEAFICSVEPFHRFPQDPPPNNSGLWLVVLSEVGRPHLVTLDLLVYRDGTWFVPTDQGDEHLGQSTLVSAWANPLEVAPGIVERLRMRHA